jgi:hypothetical protein
MYPIEPAPLTGPLAPRLSPDSPLVITAADLLNRHKAEVGTSMCHGCGEPYPCGPGVHAAAVCLAAGLTPQDMGVSPDVSPRALVAA